MPDATGNTLIFTIKPATPEKPECVTQHPHPANVLVGATPTIVLVANPANTKSITLTFSLPAMANVFVSPPTGPIVLAPGSSATLTIRSATDLRITHRESHFGDDPLNQFSRRVGFDSVPPRCGGGDANDVVVET